MDRKLLTESFTLDNPPAWTCPTCNKGFLRIRKDTFVPQETRQSKTERSNEWWEPEWIRYAYSCMLQCTNDKCKEHVFSVGTGAVDQDVEEGPDGGPELVYRDFYRPRYFEPYLHIIQVPENCPETISKPLRESFKLFFSSPNATANSIRIAIEELLTELDVKRFTISKGKNSKGTRRPLNLHQRIELLPTKYAEHKDLMLAIKWLGNAGSHANGQVTPDDVINAYEMLAHILEEVYTSKIRKLKEIAKKVNRKKGPVK